eukprot:g4206.t1
MVTSETQQEIVSLLVTLNEKVRVLEAAILEKDAQATCSSEAEEGEEENIYDDDGGISLNILIPALFVGVSVLSLIYILRDEIRICRKKSREGVDVFEVVSYRLDFLFSTVGSTKPLMLLYVTSFLIIAGGVMFWVVSPSASFGEAMWESWQFIQSGDHFELDTFGETVVGLFMTIAGMGIFGFMIGIIEDMLSDYMDNLKEGKSRVVETGHTLILGWSDKTIPIIDEIAEANASEGGGTIVVLAEMDKEELEGHIADHDIDLKGTSIVCRSGSPSMGFDLRKCSASDARSVVCLADPNKTHEENDFAVIRTVLALLTESIRGNVVAEIGDKSNVRLVKQLCDRAECIVAPELIGRLMIQCTRTRGMHAVLSSVLGFEGSEFYFSEWPELVSSKVEFYQAHLWFSSAILLGYRDKRSGKISINPSPSTKVTSNMELIFFAEDDDTYEAEKPQREQMARWKNQEKISQTAFYDRMFRETSRSEDSEHVLLVGWRKRMWEMVSDLDSCIAPGSSVTILCELGLAEREASMSRSYFMTTGREVGRGRSLSKLSRLVDGAENSKTSAADFENELREAERTECDRFGFKNLVRVEHIVESAVVRANLECLGLERFDVALILSDESRGSTRTAKEKDSQSISTLLQLRDIRAELKRSSKKCDCPILAEILDPHTKQLLWNHSREDCVTSNELVSKAMAMVSERREVNTILEELLTDVGNEFYVEPASRYVGEGELASFFDLCARASTRGDILFGYSEGPAGEAGSKLILNPSEKHTLRRWSKGDCLVLIHE